MIRNLVTALSASGLVIAVSLLVLPLAASAQATPTAGSSGLICPTLVRTLSLGSTGTDVANLQGFLAQNPLIYPEGSVTAYFGLLTQAAVQRWQSAYGVVSSGTPATTGYGVVGARTRAAISASCAATASSGSANASVTIPAVGSKQPLCPIAPQPATICPGTWSPLTNATGCTIAWQCTTMLPGAASSTATSSATATTSPASCGAYTMPLCSGGTLQWLGMSANDCNLGYQCITH